MYSSSSSTYPPGLAVALQARWQERELDEALLPENSILVRLLETMYQASLMREEGEPIQCRSVFASPEVFRDAIEDGGNPLNVLRFAEPTPYTPHNLRKLAAAAGYYRALLAVDLSDSEELVVWGMVITGTQWVKDATLTRVTKHLLPPNLVIQIVGPGHLVAASGYHRVLESTGGYLLTEGFDPFLSSWLPRRFLPVRETLINELIDSRAYFGTTELCESFIKDVAQSVIRRVLQLVRSRSHGGMLIYLTENTSRDEVTDEWFRFRVRFENDDSTLRFRKLMLRLIKRGLEVGEAEGLPMLTYQAYQSMKDAELKELEEAFVEFSHFLADLMSVDGCLVMDQSFRLLGFGAEILGDVPARRIARALDLESEQFSIEPADSSGTRHRSAYRLVHGLKEAIAVVVSQDGDVRFVADHKDRLTYWPYLP